MVLLRLQKNFLCYAEHLRPIFLIKSSGIIRRSRSSDPVRFVFHLEGDKKSQLSLLVRFVDQKVPRVFSPKKRYLLPNETHCELRVLASFVDEIIPLKLRLFVRPNDAHCQLRVLARFVDQRFPLK